MTWSFDMHGINNNSGGRIATLAERIRMNSKNAKRLGYMMSAAPEMLEALQMVRSLHKTPDMVDEDEVIDKVIKAIEKAQGKEKKDETVKRSLFNKEEKTEEVKDGKQSC